MTQDALKGMTAERLSWIEVAADDTRMDIMPSIRVALNELLAEVKRLRRLQPKSRATLSADVAHMPDSGESRPPAGKEQSVRNREVGGLAGHPSAESVAHSSSAVESKLVNVCPKCANTHWCPRDCSAGPSELQQHWQAVLEFLDRRCPHLSTCPWPSVEYLRQFFPTSQQVDVSVKEVKPPTAPDYFGLFVNGIEVQTFEYETDAERVAAVLRKAIGG